MATPFMPSFTALSIIVPISEAPSSKENCVNNSEFQVFIVGCITLMMRKSSVILILGDFGDTSVLYNTIITT